MPPIDVTNGNPSPPRTRKLPSEGQTIPSTWKFLLRFASAHLGRLSAATVLTVIAGILSVAPWILLAQIIMTLQSAADKSVSLWFVAGLGAVVLLRVLCISLGSALFHLLADDIARDVRTTILDRLLTAPLARIEARGKGALVEAVLSDTERLESFVAHHLSDIITAFVVPICVAVVLLGLYWPLALALIALPVLGLTLVMYAFSGDASAQKSAAFDTAQVALSARSNEFISGLSVIRFFSGSGKAKGFLTRAIDRLHSLETEWVLSALTPYAAQRAMGLICIAAAVLLGGYLYAMEWLSLGDWLIFVCLAPVLIEPLDKLAHITLSLMEFDVSAVRIAEMIGWSEAEPERNRIADLELAPLTVYDLTMKLDGQTVINNVNLHIPPKGLTVIVGRTGSGKSSLLRVLGRFDPPTTGRILYGTCDLKDLAPQTWERHISFSFQETFFKRASVTENLQLANPAADAELMRATCRVAGALDFVDALPEQFETIIGQGGWPLSAGQEQRLALVRVLLRDPPVLFLDEALAHVELEQESAIMKRVFEARRDQITVMVSHRMDFTLSADHIVVMENGGIAGEGTHETLIRTCKAYRTLWGTDEEPNK